jgi:hypothetical protein
MDTTFELWLIRSIRCTSAPCLLRATTKSDVFNTLDTSGPVSEPFRTQAVVHGYAEGVPTDMEDVECGKLNRAHQLTQVRAGGSNPPCALIGKGCQETMIPTSLAYTMEGVMRTCVQHVRKTGGHPDVDQTVNRSGQVLSRAS